MGYVSTPPQTPSVAVSGSEDRFAVRRIYCVGRNYLAHIREMGNDERDPPFFFGKPADCIRETGGTVAYPPQTDNLHYEIEMVVAIGKGGRDIAPSDVHDHIWGAAVGIDLTRRDMQLVAKEMGRPWDLSKGFDGAAPISPLTPLADVPSLSSGRIWLSVNDEIRQEGDLSEMIWPVAEHVSILSHAVALQPGDLIFTGTPAGVGPVRPGDRIAGGVEGLTDIEIAIGPRHGTARDDL